MLDYLIDIIAKFGRVVAIVYYGNDSDYPESRSLQGAKRYRTLITRMFSELSAEIYTIVDEKIQSQDHMLYKVIVNLRISITGSP